MVTIQAGCVYEKPQVGTVELKGEYDVPGNQLPAQGLLLVVHPRYCGCVPGAEFCNLLGDSKGELTVLRGKRKVLAFPGASNCGHKCCLGHLMGSSMRLNPAAGSPIT